MASLKEQLRTQTLAQKSRTAEKRDQNAMDLLEGGNEAQRLLSEREAELAQWSEQLSAQQSALDEDATSMVEEMEEIERRKRDLEQRLKDVERKHMQIKSRPAIKPSRSVHRSQNVSM